MAKVRNESNLRKYAIIGARVRIQDLQAEIDRIKKQFGRRTLLISDKPGASTASQSTSTVTRKRRKMSAAARKKIGDAQRARWAKQKAKNK